MTPLETFRRRRLATCVISWLLVALVPLQGVVAAALGAAGPAHTHQASEASLVLEDVRRAQTPEPEREMHVATAFGHFHGSGSPKRHFHRVNDGSVVFVDDGGLAQAQGADSGGLDHGAASAGGPLPTSIAWIIPTATQARPLHVSWPWLTFEPEPFERPPRFA